MPEVFEVHITGNESIHDVARSFNHKTIAIDLLKPDGEVLREEHMTSLLLKAENYATVKAEVDQIVENYALNGVSIIRVKIESPYYEHYVNQSLYMESHFVSNDFKFATSRNQKKTTLLATDRCWHINQYVNFMKNNSEHELELCLFDNNPYEDGDWLHSYEDNHYLPK